MEAHKEIRVPYDYVIKLNIFVSIYLVIFVGINFYWMRYMMEGSIIYK